MVRIEFTIQRRHLFIIAGLFAAAVVLMPSMSRASHTFDDVDDSNVFHTDIDWLAANDVTRGCNPPTNTQFCPGSNVTRQQMAAFMQRLATNQVVDAGSLGGVDAEVLLDRIEALEGLLAGVSRNGDILLFDGMNLQLVNGEGTTNSTNSLGNLIIGYNTSVGDTRTGSHTLVIGDRHTYTGYGGIVSGFDNATTGAWASVTGGQGNTASASNSAVSGGSYNTASNAWASVTGGQGNTASASNSAVSGGRDNTASSFDSAVSGGRNNTASGAYSSVTGGENNTASEPYSAIVGGFSGGFGVNATHGTIVGGFNNMAGADYVSMLGGKDNLTTGIYSTIAGGDGVICSSTAAALCGEGSITAAD